MYMFWGAQADLTDPHTSTLDEFADKMREVDK
jgi:hypothetical protein